MNFHDFHRLWKIFIDSDGFSWILIDFQFFIRFSSILIDFLGFFMDFHRFSLIIFSRGTMH